MSVSLRTFSAGASVCRPGLTCLLRSKQRVIDSLARLFETKGEKTWTAAML